MSTVSLQISTVAVGYTSVFLLFVWAVVGAYFRQSTGQYWSMYHKATYVAAPLLAILSLALLLLDIM